MLWTLPLLLLEMSSCQTSSSAQEPSAVCTAFPPITWSAQDTAATVLQVKKHNAAWTVLCRSKP